MLLLHLSILLFLLFLFLLEVLAVSTIEKRRPEKLFSSTIYIAGHTVTCDAGAAPDPSMFVADTWTCYNIKVDGLRLRYWYLSGFGADTACGDGQDVYDARNDMPALCRTMLSQHSVHRPLWAAFMNDASCSYIDEKRMIYVKGEKEGEEDLYKWEEFSKGNGYFKTLRCQVHDT